MAKFLSDSGLLTLVQKIKEEFDSIYETIIDNEEVTASALTDINTKYNDINNAIDTIEDTIDNLATVATSGSYNDLSNKPDYGNAKIFYGTCSTAAGTAVKEVTCSEFTSTNLVAGALIFVKFSATNSATAANLKLDVNSTGAKSIKKQYTNQTAQNLNAVGELVANRSYLFTYDGTYWVCMTLDYNSNTTYSGMAIADLITGTATTNRLISASTLKAAYNINGQVITIGANSITVPVLELSEDYEMSSEISDISLEAGDTFDEAFGKLEKAINNNEQVTASGLTDLNERITSNESSIEDIQADISDLDQQVTLAGKTPVVNHETSDTTFTLTPNTYHIWGEVSTLTLTFGAGETGYLAEYMFEFQSGNTATVLTLPNTVKWPVTPTIAANKIYQVSIVNNIGLIIGVDV